MNLRERRAALEQALLNRALRANKGRVDRAITRLVMTQIPTVEPEPGRAKVVDGTETT
ncbi:hypothetical protein [Nocardioides sp. Root190]|uniref:hypothetical protein n=1 Tax=Nocardioides sp. Root190 TaxID=1736488 RepID=UPI0012FCA9A8|nr:hypothetical protein [Nocardioides sp. Root190]